MVISSQVIRVKKDKIMACMTCPICNKLLQQATTISLCLHTFCRKCIYERLSDDEVESCPVCDINLGIVPVDKLRPDHNLQDIRAKIFPLKRRKVEAPEIAPSVSPPVKRKERSLSSLVVSTPRVSMKAGITGRRTRGGVRKGSAPKGPSPAVEGTPNKDENIAEDCLEGSSSPETLNKIIQNKKQNSLAKSSNNQIRGDNTENSDEKWDGKVDLWKPLNTLVEAASRSKSSKASLQLQGPSLAKPDLSSCVDANVCTKVKVDDNKGLQTESQDDKSNMPSVPGPKKRRKMRQSNKNPTSGSANSRSSQVMPNATRHNWKDGPIWFSLVAFSDPVGGEPLPQISAAFLRVKNGNMPVSSIQQYIVKKLALTSEVEVQLTCQGQPVLPHLKLSNLLDLWRPSSSARIKTSVGNSAKEYVMVLSYSQKVATPAF